jgi:glucokinase
MLGKATLAAPQSQTSAAFSLLGDIGATNARFGLLDTAGKIDCIRVLACRDFAGLGEAVEAYLERVRSDGLELLVRPAAAAVAVAGPVTDDQVAFTNHVWFFSQAALKSSLKLDRLLIVNDFTTVAACAPHLAPSDLDCIGGGATADTGQKTTIGVLGPGTGLGVGGALPVDGRWVVLTGEGGHVSLAPSTERESRVLDVMRRRFGHASAERALSGPGLVNLYSILAEIDGVTPKPYIPAQVTEMAIGGGDPHCREALAMFAEMLATKASDLALTLGARGGIYIGGGIVPRLGHAFSAQRFRRRFEQKGRLSPYIADIPSFIIRHPFPAFVGLAALLRDASTIAAPLE